MKFDLWDAFITELKTSFLTYEFSGEKDLYNLYTKGAIRDYHYNLRVGSGSGAVFVGYQHNAEKSVSGSFTLKVEFNPSKPTKEQEMLLNVFKTTFKDKEILVKGLDLAFDVQEPKEKIFVFSLTGRSQDRNKGTAYFGTRGKTGYLKVYNKKKELEEKQGETVEYDYLTRIEYSLRMKDAITLSMFSSVDNFSINELYKIHLIEDENALDPFMKAAFFSYLNGYQDLKEFSKYQRNKIKKALDSFRLVDLDNRYSNAKQEIFISLKNLLLTL